MNKPGKAAVSDVIELAVGTPVATAAPRISSRTDGIPAPSATASTIPRLSAVGGGYRQWSLHFSVQPRPPAEITRARKTISEPQPAPCAGTCRFTLDVVIIAMITKRITNGIASHL